MSALGLCKARKTGAGMNEVGEDLIDDLDGKSFEGAFGLYYRCLYL